MNIMPSAGSTIGLEGLEPEVEHHLGEVAVVGDGHGQAWHGPAPFPRDADQGSLIINISEPADKLKVRQGK